MQSSSHNFPIKISEPIFKLLKLNATLAFSVNLFNSGRIAFFVRDIMRPYATSTPGIKILWHCHICLDLAG